MKKICSIILYSALVIFLMSQCVTKKNLRGPNISAIYGIQTLTKQLPALPSENQPSNQASLPEPVQAIFQRLFTLDSTVALETGRLPAFQRNIGEKETLALARLTELVENATPAQKINLESLLNIGLKDSRRYSSPLEAIFWILEKDDYDRNKQVLGLDLEELLDKAWDFSDRTRWGEYETVTDRLNAPELVNYYQRIRLVYKSKRGRKDALVGDARRLFSINVGNCYDHARFAAYCLEKADFKTSIVGVHPVVPRYHGVCKFEAGGNSFIIDNGRPDKFLRRGIIPAEEYEMYHGKENVRKGKSTKDPVYLLQDNYGLALIYLMDRKERVTSVEAICDDLGLRVFEEKVKHEYLPALIHSGFITKLIPHKGGSSEEIEYTINESLCERFKKERYHRPLNAAAKW